MRNSDKCTLKAFIFLFLGCLFGWYLTFTESNLLHDQSVGAVSFVAAIFAYAGYNYGAARGWHDIELRRTNPDAFIGERIEED